MVLGLRQQIVGHRSLTWRYEDKAGRHRTPTVYMERRVRSVPFLRWDNRQWETRAAKAKHYYLTHRGARRSSYMGGGIAHEQLWLCIHRGEGAWNANTGNGYYGGLQMTISWDGLIYRADLHSPYEQMRAAETGYRESGYSRSWLEGQWPNTSPPCLGYA